MNAAKTFLAGFLTLLCWVGIAVAGPGPQAVLDALPSEENLGQGWTRRLSLLCDPLSNPPEILPEARKKEHNAGVEDPKGKVSGWAHPLFTFQGTNGPLAYDVEIERYRKTEDLKEDFDQLLRHDSERFKKAPVKGLGDAAVFYRDTQGFGGTLWFRRADFKVWIAPIGGLTNWVKDTHLQHLAKTLDRRIVRGSLHTRKSSQSGKQQREP